MKKKKKLKQNQSHQKITPNIKLADLVRQYPLLAQVLEEEFELHCLNCPISSLETLAEGARAHGYTDEDILEIVDYLNKILEYQEKDSK